jgi:glutathione synthase/RimK-type ligase-like ATP-grasp enzyme
MKVLFLFAHQGVSNNPQQFQSKLGDFFQYAKQRHETDFCIAAISKYDGVSRTFSHAFTYAGGVWKVENFVKPDVIYDKTIYFLSSPKLTQTRKNISLNFPFFNDLDLNHLLTDKWKTYELFPDLHPRTVLIQHENDLEKIQAIPSAMIVAKPQDGFGGKDIIISKKENFKPTSFPFIAQEFIETNSGIPGIIGGRHDLRIIIKNEDPFYAIVRSPKNNQYLANTIFGGSLTVIPIEKIPQSVFDILNKVKERFSSFIKKLYSIDFIFDSQGKPLIVEGNSRPGIALHQSELPYREYYYDNIINFFTKK